MGILKNHGLELALFFALAVVASFLVYDKMIIFSVVILFTIALFFLAEGYRIPKEDRSLIWKLSLGALLLRILFIIGTLIFSNPFLTADGISYGQMGDAIARSWHDGIYPVIGNANYGYYYFNAFIYYVTGYYPEVLRLINSVIAIGTALNLYFISLRLSGRKAAKFTFILTAFFPSFIVWSGLNLKESIITFLITYIVKNTLEITQKFHFNKLIGISLALLPLVTMRFYIGILVGIVLTVSFLVAGSNLSWYKRLFYTIIILLVAGIALYHMGYGFLGVDYLKTQSLSTVEKQHNAGAIESSAYSENVDFSSPMRALKYLPLGLFYFFWGPLPWQPGGILKLLSLPEMCLLYILYIYVIPGISSLWRCRRGECLFLLIIIFTFTIIYALGGSNMGGIYRVRFQVLSLLFPLISHGMLGQEQYNWLQLLRSRIKVRSE